jgi:hypothetical protein
LKVESLKRKKDKERILHRGPQRHRGRREEGQSRRRRKVMKKGTKKRAKRDFSLRGPTRLQEQT